MNFVVRQSSYKYLAYAYAERRISQLAIVFSFVSLNCRCEEKSGKEKMKESCIELIENECTRKVPIFSVCVCQCVCVVPVISISNDIQIVISLSRYSLIFTHFIRIVFNGSLKMEDRVTRKTNGSHNLSRSAHGVDGNNGNTSTNKNGANGVILTVWHFEGTIGILQ